GDQWLALSRCNFWFAQAESAPAPATRCAETRYRAGLAAVVAVVWAGVKTVRPAASLAPATDDPDAVWPWGNAGANPRPVLLRCHQVAAHKFRLRRAPVKVPQTHVGRLDRLY